MLICNPKGVITTRCYASIVLAIIVCPSVCPSITCRYCIKTAKPKFREIQMRSPQMGHQMQVRYDKMGDFLQITRKWYKIDA